MKNDIEKFEKMDPDDRRFEARDRVVKMIIMRIAISALLIWVIFTAELPVFAVVVLSVVIVLILGTLLPVLTALRTTLKDPDEEESASE